MRRFDKKKIIHAANLRLEQDRLFEMITLNEIGDSKGYPYEVVSDWGSMGHRVGFKVPKDENEITDEDPTTEWNMFVSISIKAKSSYSGFDSDFESLIRELGFEGENLPDDIFGVYISFGVFKDESGNVSFPELNTNKVFSIMATVRAAILEVVEKTIQEGKRLVVVYSYPVTGGKKETDLREKLYNLYYDMEIKRSKIMNNFKKFRIRSLSGIFNVDLLSDEMKNYEKKANLMIHVIKRGSMDLDDEDFYNAFIKMFDEDKDSFFVQKGKLEPKQQGSIEYMEYLLKSVTATEAKNFFQYFNEKTGYDLFKAYKAIVYYDNKTIKNIEEII
jgi:hypothetical protein